MIYDDTVRYDVMVADIAASEDLSEKANMAVAYVIFEDLLSNVSDGSTPDPEETSRIQDEAVQIAYSMSMNLPALLKKAVQKKEALFFQERLANYGVTVDLVASEGVTEKRGRGKEVREFALGMVGIAIFAILTTVVIFAARGFI